MIASDLPERHRTPRRMARCLASYIDDPAYIYRMVFETFGKSPSTATIRQMRINYQKPMVEYVADPADSYRPVKHHEDLDRINQRFLAALKLAYPERFADPPANR